jgi:outer membrane protein assembly factor BamB
MRHRLRFVRLPGADDTLSRREEVSALASHSTIVLLLASALAVQGDWPQFRGPNATGVSEATNLPVSFGPEDNVLWKTSVPMGNSSPVVARDKVYITGVDGDRLLTIAIDKQNGRVVWRQDAPRPRKQVIERPANGPASASPASDGRNVFVFFQDFGLLAYGPEGRELWRLPLGPIANPFGHGASPVLMGTTLLMNVDQDVGSFLLAVEKDSGRVLWRRERPFAQRGYATPVLVRRPDADQVVVAGSYRLSAYDIRSGQELWWIRRLPWQIKPTPVVSGQNIYFVTYSGESEPGQQETIPAFQEALAKLDVDKDGRLSKDEVPDPAAKARFDEYLDLDDSGYLEERDWKQYQERRVGENGLRAYRLGGAGDVTDTHALWTYSRSLPNVPSPLVYRDVLYTLKEGGIFTSFDLGTGKVVKQARLQGALGDYYASPVAADGKIYTISEEGKASVIEAGRDWHVMQVNDLRDGCKGTPAIADGRLYIRTYGTLYCFSKQR